MRALSAIFNQPISRPIVPKRPSWKAAALAAGLGLSMFSYPVYAAPASGGDTVQGLYDLLLSTMKNSRTLSQSGRFTQLEPVVGRTFDIPSMARLSVGRSWASLSEAQRQQVTESLARYISAIYADRFDNYAGQQRLSCSAGYNQRLPNGAPMPLRPLSNGRSAGSDMTVAGRGMNEPRVPTPVGVREPQNRRVEIVFP